MKKALKTAGWALLSLLLLSVAAGLLVRCCFRRQAADWLGKLLLRERIELLREAAPYAADTVSYRFRYRQDDRRAGELRSYFRLDTLLRPEADTWENTLALARFVSSRIPHANQTIRPEVRNAVGLWEYSRTVEPAFNCRLHSIMLHELLLASGIVNRFVTCLPADPDDDDCHVVNLVWLPERRKWAMIDSDMGAWIADADSAPLSLEEMRARCIAGAPMEVRPLAEGRDMRHYLAYWAKNLYRFECWEETGYDQEINYEGRCVELLPPGFGSRSSDGRDIPTTDAARFWAAPDTPNVR